MLIQRLAVVLILMGTTEACSVRAHNATSRPDVDGDSIAAVQDTDSQEMPPIKKVLFIGDSMTGWMAERLNAYGAINDFEVATIVWDGSTIKKWGNSPKLQEIIAEQDADAIFISLGMNELFEPNPDKNLREAIDNIKNSIGHKQFLWIGPPSWPGHDEGKKLNDWLESELGSKNYFRSSDLNLPRQSASNPHPDRTGIETWIDDVVEWIPTNTDLKFDSLNPPSKGVMSRGKTFIYKRMKEDL